MARRALGWALMVLCASALSFGTSVLADGGKAKNAVYRGIALLQAGRSVEFEIDTSPIIFYVGTVNRKYHVLLIRAKNYGDEPLRLSKEQDSIVLHYSDGLDVEGIIDLPTADPETWDGLEEEIRTAVAYPPIVQAREEEGIYVFVPVDAVVAPRKKHEMPFLISFGIKSLPQPIELRAPVAAA
jgi:hypothetical protein